MGARLEIAISRAPSNLPQILKNKSGGGFSAYQTIIISKNLLPDS
jgi:hypothetical protein